MIYSKACALCKKVKSYGKCGIRPATGPPEQKVKARTHWETFAKACEADGIQYLGLGRTLKEQSDKIIKLSHENIYFPGVNPSIN
ncbi:MAG: hypothetical protein WC975_16195 [Phycisphaerae bacterium]